jgi:hypothetical protein
MPQTLWKPGPITSISAHTFVPEVLWPFGHIETLGKPTVRTALICAWAVVLLASCQRERAQFCAPQSDFTHQGKGFYRDAEGVLHQQVFVYSRYEPADGYFCYRAVPEIDVDSWSHLFNMYWRDAENVYHIRTTSEGEQIALLQGANPDNFFPADTLGFIAKDEDQVWVSGAELKGVNASEVMCTGDYTWDHKMVYFLADRVEGADAESFQVLGQGIARDAFRMYQHGTPVNHDPRPMAFRFP